VRPANKRQKNRGVSGEVSFGYFRKGNAILRLNAPKSSGPEGKCVLGTVALETKAADSFIRRRFA